MSKYDCASDHSVHLLTYKDNTKPKEFKTPEKSSQSKHTLWEVLKFIGKQTF